MIIDYFNLEPRFFVALDQHSRTERPWKVLIRNPKISFFQFNCACLAESHVPQSGSYCFSSGRFHCFLNQLKSVLQQNSLESHSPAQKVATTRGTNLKITGKCNTYLLLTEFEGRTVSYGPNFFLLDLWPKREARGP